MSSTVLPILKLNTQGLRPAKDLGKPGKLAWIPLSKIVIDTKYQRPVAERGARNIGQIVEGFKWAYFSPLVVTKRENGTYAAIDGQHRAIAAKTHGAIGEVPCLIIEADRQIEALAFTIINGQVTSVMPSHIFYARVAAEDPTAVGLLKACETAKVNVLRMPTTVYKIGDTLAIGTLQTCFKRFGKETLITALQTITETGNGNPGMVRAPIISGTCEVLNENTNWRDAGEKLFKAIERVGVPGLYALAMREQAQVGGSLRIFYGKHLRVTLQAALGRRAA